MIQKYLYGVPFDTESVAAPIPASQGEPPVGTVKTSETGFCFACPLAECDRVYGLGEANRGINKRSFVYVSDNVDDGLHTGEVTGVLRKTAGALPVLNRAFEKQFTHLMQGELLDVEADIGLLNSMLELEDGR